MPGILSDTLNLSDESDDEQPDTDSAFLLYHAASHVTGERLGQYLGIPHGRECEDRYDHLIRWGSRSRVSYAPREGPLNSRSAIRDNTDKLGALRAMDNAGIPVPQWTTDRDEISETFGYPALGRAEEHTRGEDINLILQWRDAYLTSGNDFFVNYIPTDLEYRAHVVNGEVIHWHEKRLRSEASNHPFIRNAETGWVFVSPREETPSDQLAIDAVGCLGLDFGAVDILRSEGGEEYVLEVNTAPSLDEANLRRYGDAFADACNLGEPAGMERVEWGDDEDTEEDEGLGEMFG
jgi:hypothetical protein